MYHARLIRVMRVEYYFFLKLIWLLGSTTLRVKRGVKGNCRVSLRRDVFESSVFPVLGFKDSSET